MQEGVQCWTRVHRTVRGQGRRLGREGTQTVRVKAGSGHWEAAWPEGPGESALGAGPQELGDQMGQFENGVLGGCSRKG